MQKITNTKKTIKFHSSLIAKIKKNIFKNNIEEHLIKAENDIENGRVKKSEEVFKEWQEKYGI